jgi:hypothetical protein
MAQTERVISEHIKEAINKQLNKKKSIFEELGIEEVGK